MKNKELCKNCRGQEEENQVLTSLEPDYIITGLKEEAILSVEDIFEDNVKGLLDFSIKMEEINRNCLLMYYLKSRYEDFGEFLDNYQHT